MSHTSGPWRIEEEGMYGRTSIVAADGSTLICNEDYYPSVPANEDDWKLIAAAPELLSALKLVVDISDRKHDAWDAARAAIAKATGAK